MLRLYQRNDGLSLHRIHKFSAMVDGKLITGRLGIRRNRPLRKGALAQSGANVAPTSWQSKGPGIGT